MVAERPTLLAELTWPAIEALDADPLSERVLGPELKRAYVELKTAEWWDYHNTVFDWELERYLTFF
jgi:glutamine synthetase